MTIKCTAGYIDNIATPDCTTFLEISLENSSGKIVVNNKEVGPRSEHTFIISDATLLGLKGNYNLTKEQATDIFLLSCSLVMPRYYLSLIQPVQLSSEVEYISMPSKVQINENPSEKQVLISCCIGVGEARVFSCLSSKVNIDEKQLFQIVEILLQYNIFDPQNRTLDELNVIEAIKSYREAFTTTEFTSLYLLMYSALEKTVNSDKDRKGSDFDVKVSNLTGMKQDKIEKIRLFDNRLKHPLKNSSNDLCTLRNGQNEIGILLRDLKKTTDMIILAKLSKS